MKTTSSFERSAERNRAALDQLRQLSASTDRPSLATEELRLVEDLLGPLNATPPDRSAAGEAALTISLISLAEGRALNVVDAATGDITDRSKRLEGDRTLSEELSTWLDKQNIPCTAGALQSSTYRAGYSAGQAQTTALPAFANWLSKPGRKLRDVREVAGVLLAGFLAQAAELPPLPKLRRDALIAVVFRELVEDLFSAGSQGAYEQYLVTGLLRAEIMATGRAVRAETKSVKASDKTTGAAGDVQIREGQRLVDAIEVSAAPWQTKLAQIAKGAQQLAGVTIVARGVQASSGDELAAAQTADTRLANLDLRFVDLMALVDVCSSRLDGSGRADALAYLYRCLAKWHRSEPRLVSRLVSVIEAAGVAESSRQTAELSVADVQAEEQADDVAQRVIMRLQQGGLIGDEQLQADLRLLQTLASRGSEATDAEA